MNVAIVSLFRIIFEGSVRIGEDIADREGGIPMVERKRRGPKGSAAFQKMELNPGELMRHFREFWGHEPEASLVLIAMLVIF